MSEIDDKKRGIANRGLIPRKPVLVERCHRRQIKVPGSYAEFERLVRKWISSCVLSRTKKRDGEPFRREEELVASTNASVPDVWSRIAHLTGETVTIEATYDWVLFGRRWGVGGITFTTDVLTQRPRGVFLEAEPSSLPQLPGPEGIPDPRSVIPPPPRNLQEAIDRAMSAMWTAPIDWVREPIWRKRIYCMLSALRKDYVDDRFISDTKLEVGIGLGSISHAFPANEKDMEVFVTRARPEIMSFAKKSPKALTSSLQELDKDIADAISRFSAAYVAEQSSIYRGMVFMKDWVKDQSGALSIYQCYR
jgi:hypothetical protein